MLLLIILLLLFSLPILRVHIFIELLSRLGPFSSLFSRVATVVLKIFLVSLSVCVSVLACWSKIFLPVSLFSVRCSLSLCSFHV